MMKKWVLYWMQLGFAIFLMGATMASTALAQAPLWEENFRGGNLNEELWHTYRNTGGEVSQREFLRFKTGGGDVVAPGVKVIPGRTVRIKFVASASDNTGALVFGLTNNSGGYDNPYTSDSALYSLVVKPQGTPVFQADNGSNTATIGSTYDAASPYYLEIVYNETADMDYKVFGPDGAQIGATATLARPAGFTELYPVIAGSGTITALVDYFQVWETTAVPANPRSYPNEQFVEEFDSDGSVDQDLWYGPGSGSTQVWSGAARYTASGNYSKVASLKHLFVQPGDTIRFRVSETENNPYRQVIFGLSNNSGNTVGGTNALFQDQQYFQIWSDPSLVGTAPYTTAHVRKSLAGSGGETAGSIHASTLSPPNYIYQVFDLTWNTDGTMTATAYQDDGTLLGSFTSTESWSADMYTILGLGGGAASNTAIFDWIRVYSGTPPAVTDTKTPYVAENFTAPANALSSGWVASDRAGGSLESSQNEAARLYVNATGARADFTSYGDRAFPGDTVVFKFSPVAVAGSIEFGLFNTQYDPYYASAHVALRVPAGGTDTIYAYHAVGGLGLTNVLGGGEFYSTSEWLYCVIEYGAANTVYTVYQADGTPFSNPVTHAYANTDPLLVGAWLSGSGNSELHIDSVRVWRGSTPTVDEILERNVTDGPRFEYGFNYGAMPGGSEQALHDIIWADKEDDPESGTGTAVVNLLSDRVQFTSNDNGWKSSMFSKHHRLRSGEVMRALFVQAADPADYDNFAMGLRDDILTGHALDASAERAMVTYPDGSAASPACFAQNDPGNGGATRSDLGRGSITDEWNVWEINYDNGTTYTRRLQNGASVGNTVYKTENPTTDPYAMAFGSVSDYPGEVGWVKIYASPVAASFGLDALDYVGPPALTGINLADADPTDNTSPTLLTNDAIAITFTGVTGEPTKVYVSEDGWATSSTISYNASGVSYTLSDTSPGLKTLEVILGNEGTFLSSAVSDTITYDANGPTVDSFDVAVGQDLVTTLTPILFTLTFNEPVQNTPSITWVTGAGTASVAADNVVRLTSSTFEVQAVSVITSGTVQPELVTDSVMDLAGNSNSAGATAAQSVQRNMGDAPEVLGVLRHNPTEANVNGDEGNLQFRVLFNSAMSNIEPSGSDDFLLIQDFGMDASILGATSGDGGKTWVVTVDPGMESGDLRLDVKHDGTTPIKDAFNRNLPGSYSGGQTFSVFFLPEAGAGNWTLY